MAYLECEFCGGDEALSHRDSDYKLECINCRMKREARSEKAAKTRAANRGKS